MIQTLAQSGSAVAAVAMRAAVVKGVASIVGTSFSVKVLPEPAPVASYSCMLTPSPARAPARDEKSSARGEGRSARTLGIVRREG